MVSCYLPNATSLEMLDLSGNNMVKLSMEMFVSLQLLELNLSNNYIMEIDRGTFDTLKGLTVLNLARSSIHCISSFDLTQLHFLNLSSNALGFFLSSDTEEPYRLRNLDLSHNKLFYFPVLPKFHAIQYLNLSGNTLAAITPPSAEALANLGSLSWHEASAEPNLFSSDQNKTSDLMHVTDLDLSGNHLTSLPVHFLSNLNSLQYLNVAHNCHENMTDVSSPDTSNQMANIMTLSEMDVTLISLRILDLQGDDIRSLPQWLFNFVPEIEHLNLMHNSIKLCSNRHVKKDQSASKERVCTSFSGALHLNYLNLRGNHIKQLPPYVFHQTALVSLDLSDNKDMKIAANALGSLGRSLQILSLNGNQMNDSQTKLPCLKVLKSLDLSKLSVIPPNLYCSHLETLDLQHNSLHLLDKKVAFVWAKSLTRLCISGNPFSCCSLKWLEPLQIARVNMSDLDDAHCIYRSDNMSVRANVSNDHSQHCSHLAGNSYLYLVRMSIILAVFTLCSVACFMFKKGGPKSHITFKFKSNKIASETISPSKDRETEDMPMEFIPN
ncbi:transforming growth factor beta activator LRRC33-like [Ascaphus truei]|uniref:transforming growth factor beta activator LRRC33-like n=1 Tax=Ascaphus truei TaxID=8439 RepID=UPI003F5AD234